ncbi:MAG TPA: TetR family transcriptional regulator [Candidatus Saccharimonadales bacterium]|nr:TetR family transcriptional regulator [Candidatus Saccharimonadales bacterium]
MAASKNKPAAQRVRNAAASRGSILEHAIAEFAARGVAGARTAAIAEAAGVNKALLYYYFKDKESLYSAALHEVFSGLVGDVLPMLESSLAPGEKILRFARMHFEYLVKNPNYPKLIQQEMSRVRATGEASRDFRAISAAHFVPLQKAGLKAMRDGIACGEFRKIEGASALSMMLGMNVFYFNSAPIMRMVRGVDPFSPECIQRHIATALDFIGAALFADREHGIRLAKKIAGAALALPREFRGKRLMEGTSSL